MNLGSLVNWRSGMLDSEKEDNGMNMHEFSLILTCQHITLIMLTTVVQFDNGTMVLGHVCWKILHNFMHYYQEIKESKLIEGQYNSTWWGINLLTIQKGSGGLCDFYSIRFKM